MTYCVALRLDRGLVFAADTRTSAGTANVAQYRKLHYWRKPGERVIVLLSAGNLSVTQSVVSLLNEQLVQEPARGASTLFTVPSLYRAARLVGDAVREVRRVDGAALEDSSSGFNASFILGGQIGSETPRLFHDLSRRQLHRGDRRHAVLPDRRAQVRQADPGPGGAAQHAPGRGGQDGAAVVRFDPALEPVGRPADRPPDLRARLASTCGARSASSRPTNTSASCRPPGPTRCAPPSPRWRSSRSRAALCRSRRSDKSRIVGVGAQAWRGTRRPATISAKAR